MIPNYSFRRATIGCTLAARRAGVNDASSAARANSSVATVSITGSQGLSGTWLASQSWSSTFSLAIVRVGHEPANPRLHAHGLEEISGDPLPIARIRGLL
jgi:hypothetical protein